MSTTIETLNGRSVPYVLIDDLPWFDAQALAAAFGFRPDVSVADVMAGRVATPLRRTVPFPSTDLGTVKRLALSPMGAWCLSLCGPHEAMVANETWVFAQAERICPDAFRDPRHGAAQTFAVAEPGYLSITPHPQSAHMDIYLAVAPEPSWMRIAAKEAVAAANAPPTLSGPTDLREQTAPRALNGHDVQFVLIDGLPFYCAASVAKALEAEPAKMIADRVASDHLRIATVQGPDGTSADRALMSAMGLWTLGLYEEARLCMAVQMWTRREAKRICPDAFNAGACGPAQMMALRPDGDLPPRPHIRTGRLEEWRDLQRLPRHMAFLRSRSIQVLSRALKADAAIADATDKKE